jgi:hypothetical protein
MRTVWQKYPNDLDVGAFFAEAMIDLRPWNQWLEDALNYDEPPGWLIPVRHSLGATLMQNGRYAEAEQIYREDLARLPEMAGPFSGWRAVCERKRKIYPKPPQRTQSSRDSGPGRTPRSPVPASASQERIGLTEIAVAGPGGGLPTEQIRPMEGSFREK